MAGTWTEKNLADIAKDLESTFRRLVAPDRIQHIEGVIDFLSNLASVYGLSAQKLRVMGLAHDLFRDLQPGKLVRIARAYGLKVNPLYLRNPILLHGPVSSAYLRLKYGIEDNDILMGIFYHTSGAPNLDPHGKALVIADSLEFSREYEKVDLLRQIAFDDLELAYKEVIRNKIIYAALNNLYLLPETLETWNTLMEVERDEDQRFLGS